MSSSCSSSIDLGSGHKDMMADSVVSDVEAFAECIAHMRATLELKGQKGESEIRCVQVREALSRVISSISDLLVKHPTFKTSQIFNPTTQLVQSVREINFANSNIDAEKSLQAISRLEAAIGDTLRNWHMASNEESSTDFTRYSTGCERTSMKNGANRTPTSWMVKLGQRTPLLLSKQFSAAVGGLGKVHKQHKEGGGGSLEHSASIVHGAYANLQRRHSSLLQSQAVPVPHMNPTTPTLLRNGRKMRNEASARPPLQLMGQHRSLDESRQRTRRLVHQNAIPTASEAVFDADGRSNPMRDLLLSHDNGLDLAFEQCKVWTKYATQLISFVRNRVALEADYAKNLCRLAEQMKVQLTADTSHLFDHDQQLLPKYNTTVASLSHHFVAALENRQKEHDSARRRLKDDWLKQRKYLEVCMDELRRARATLNTKEDGYLKAKDSTLRHGHSVPPTSLGGSTGNVAGGDPQKKRKELERKRKTEEDALIRKTDAERDVWRLENELRVRRHHLDALRAATIDALCDLIRHCNLTITACGSHFFKAFSELWAPLPHDYELLHQLIRSTPPGTEYMSFLQNTQQQHRPAGRTVSERDGYMLDAPTSSAASTHRGSNISTATTTSSPFSADYAAGGSMSGGLGAASSSQPVLLTSRSPPVMTRRRNALNVDEHCGLIAETRTQRRQKKSMVRLFDQSAPTRHPLSEAAKTHQLQRTRQVTKCAHCELAVIACYPGQVYHLKSTARHMRGVKCLTSVTIQCANHPNESAAQKRMSIFGVPLEGHLEAQRREVPLIMECCIKELEWRGLLCKGIYRTCGVKSKIEAICVFFEQCDSTSPSPEQLDLSETHPTNLASVVKLYLRRLPEPLMSYKLYGEWLKAAEELRQDGDEMQENAIELLRNIASRLPVANHCTLKYLMLHLHHCTWFKLENLMGASNLAAVITPSLIWSPSLYGSGSITPAGEAATQPSFIGEAHKLAKVIEWLIEYAHEIFRVDEAADRKAFFSKHHHLEEHRDQMSAGKVEEIEHAEDQRAIGEVDAEDELLDDDEFGDVCDDEEDEEIVIHLASLQNNVNCTIDAMPMGEEIGAPSCPISSTSTQSLRSASENMQPQPSLQAPHHKVPLKEFGKQPSFTTSILVSPQSDRREFPAIIHSQQPHSGLLGRDQCVEDRNSCNSNNNNNNGVRKPMRRGDSADTSVAQKHYSDGEGDADGKTAEKKRTLRSGEVTVDMKQEQFCPPSYGEAGKKSLTAMRNQLSSASFNNNFADTDNCAVTPRRSSPKHSPPRSQRQEEINGGGVEQPKSSSSRLEKNLSTPDTVTLSARRRSGEALRLCSSNSRKFPAAANGISYV